MSNVTIIQTYDKLWIGSDSALSIALNNTHYRLHNNGRKLFVIDDKVIFCSGNMQLASTIINNYKKLDNRNINQLQQIAKELHISDLSLDILVGTMESNQSVVYQISPYNDFEIIKRNVDDGYFAIWTGGIKTQESSEIAYGQLLNNEPIHKIYQNVFDSISYECVGGNLTVYQVDSNDINLFYENKINENNIKYIEQSLIVAEQVYGKLGAFTQVRADSIVLGDNNAGIPSSVLTVGGTNLISKSLFLSTLTNGMSNSKSGFGFFIPKGETNITFNIGQLILKENTDYMISFVVWSSTTPIQAHVQLSPTTNLPIYPFATTLTPTKITWKVNSSSAEITNCQLQFYTDGSDDCYITDIKLEQGTLATDWSPSPSDTVGVGTAYNGVQIDTVNGILVEKSDGTVKTTLNATDGLRIQQNVSGTWTDVLHEDTSGNIQYAGALTSTANMVDRSLQALLANVDGFGNSSDGIFNSTGNVTLSVASEDSASVIRMYQSFTLNYGHTLTVDKRCRGLFIFVQGDCTINGTVDMSGKGGKVSKANSTQRVLQIPVGVQTIDVPSGGIGGDGSSGGSAHYTDGTLSGSGGTGSNGTIGTWFGGGWGGIGGGGGAIGYSATSPHPPWNGGNGGTNDLDSPIGLGGTFGVEGVGTSGGDGGNFSGGGGAGSNAYSSTLDCGGGGGGAGYNGGLANSSLGAVPAASGQSGGGVGGGLVVFVVKGNLSINGNINCNGLNGGNGGSGGIPSISGRQDGIGAGGGAQGGGAGGVIVLAYRTSFSNYGTLSVNAGNGGTGGSGGSLPFAYTTSGGNGTSGTIGTIITSHV